MTVRVDGYSAISHAAAQRAFADAVTRFGEKLLAEASLVEAEYRGDRPEPQFTNWQIDRADENVRNRGSVPHRVPPWLIWIEVGHWLFTAIVGVSGGAMIQAGGFIWRQETWVPIFVASIVFGIALTFISHWGRREPQR